jgi:hypothetical protein
MSRMGEPMCQTAQTLRGTQSVNPRFRGQVVVGRSRGLAPAGRRHAWPFEHHMACQWLKLEHFALVDKTQAVKNLRLPRGPQRHVTVHRRRELGPTQPPPISARSARWAARAADGSGR